MSAIAFFWFVIILLCITVIIFAVLDLFDGGSPRVASARPRDPRQESLDRFRSESRALERKINMINSKFNHRVMSYTLELLRNIVDMTQRGDPAVAKSVTDDLTRQVITMSEIVEAYLRDQERPEIRGSLKRRWEYSRTFWRFLVYAQDKMEVLLDSYFAANRFQMNRWTPVPQKTISSSLDIRR